MAAARLPDPLWDLAAAVTALRRNPFQTCHAVMPMVFSPVSTSDNVPLW
jgi:hypothetical protein